jgi:hypothetical protein
LPGNLRGASRGLRDRGQFRSSLVDVRRSKLHVHRPPQFLAGHKVVAVRAVDILGASNPFLLGGRDLVNGTESSWDTIAVLVEGVRFEGNECHENGQDEHSDGTAITFVGGTCKVKSEMHRKGLLSMRLTYWGHGKDRMGESER